MTRRSANRKLYAVDTEIAALEAERRDLELKSFGSEISEAERRGRYFTIVDVDLRRRLIGIERSLHEMRQRQRAAAVAYRAAVEAETRAQLADLRSDSLFSAWRRRIYFDVLTVFWIIAGAGWLYRKIPGAAVGTVITAVCAWYIVRKSRPARQLAIRQGEHLLRSSESELRDAEREAGAPEAPASLFSASEAESGVAEPMG